ncbi:hypothetical protein LUZ63_004789 [Rhynchospora breviuscula]|uniref:Anaphase-promoting complex subunit 4-like WD40 domain-containing protein n=1 Tax=Rhynchospora breviuscula TaxID=2022672 RepID=A0A9Q0CMC7_9POAL|nr:hypothetical protein LUZ63_004789 [Rhynchospora breviuscula]
MPMSSSDGEDDFFDAADTSATVSVDSSRYEEECIDTLNRNPKSVDFLYGFTTLCHLSSVHERRSWFFQQVGFTELAAARPPPCHFEPDNDEILEIERFNTLTRDTVSDTPSCSTDGEPVKNQQVCLREDHSTRVLMLHEEARPDELRSFQKLKGCNRLSESVQMPLGRGDIGNNSLVGTRSILKRWWSYPVRRKLRTYEAPIMDYLQSKGPIRTNVERHRKKCIDFTSLYMNQEIKAHKGPIRVAKFSRSGRYLATAGEDCTVKIWEIREVESSFECYNRVFSEFNGKLKSVVGIEMPKKDVRSGLAIIPKQVSQIVEQPRHKFRGHTSEILDLSWSKSDCLLTASVDKTVRLWQVGSDCCLAVFQHVNYVTSVQFNPADDNEFVSGSIDGKVRLWRISENRVFDWVDTRHMVTSVCYRPDAKGFTVGCYNGTCRFYDIQGSMSEHAHDFCISSKKKSAGKMITSLQYSPDDSGRVMITTSDSSIIVTDGKDVFQKYKGLSKSKSLSPASFTCDGRYIISVRDDLRVHIWNSNSFADIPLNKKPKPIRSCETFLCENATIAVPWPGVNQAKPDLPESSDLSSPRCFSLGAWFFPLGPTVTWPEEKLSSNIHGNLLEKLGSFVNRDLGAWNAGILTAGHDGIIRSFHNYGFPVRL